MSLTSTHVDGGRARSALGENGAGGEGADAVGPHRDLGVGDLTFAALAAQLPGRLDAEVGAVATADVARAAIGVHRERPAETRVALGDERARFTFAAEPERLE